MRRSCVLVAALGLASLAFALSASAQNYPVRVAGLNGENEVSAEGEKGVGDEDGAGGARITLKSDQARVCFRLTWRNIASPTAAHIHEAGPDEAGPVVVGLFQSENPLPGTITRVQGCVDDVDAAQINEIRRNPENFYVNVHNADFPGGAIRGQLRKP